MRQIPKALISLSVWLLFACAGGPAPAAGRSWTEVKGPHFTIVTEASDRQGRERLWQFEQLRTAIHTIWPWTRADLDRPVLVLVVRDESGMKMLAPQYWEQKGSVHPAGVLVTGLDRHYIALRADVEADDRQNLNPYITAYWSYVSLVLRSGFKSDLPPWFLGGLAEVMSNTIVRESYIDLGHVIPWHLQSLRTRSRISLPELIATESGSPILRDANKLESFDAMAWAFVHFLMFSNEGAQAAKLGRYVGLLAEERPPAAAFQLAFGSTDALERDFSQYYNKQLLNYSRAAVDLSLKPEGFTTRSLSVSETASARGAWHAAARRPVEARADVEAARAADPAAPGPYEVEGIVLLGESKPDAARAAFAGAIERKSVNFFPYYWWAANPAQPATDPASRQRAEEALQRAVTLNAAYASVYAALARVQLDLKHTDQALDRAKRSVALEPGLTYARLVLAQALWATNDRAGAAREAREALAVAREDGERRSAQQAIDFYAKAMAQ